MRRAIKAIPILLSSQNEFNSIERLYKRGMLTDDMHFKVKDLKALVDQEFQDVQFEADDLVEGWSQHIWPQAMQFHTVISIHPTTRKLYALSSVKVNYPASQSVLIDNIYIDKHGKSSLIMTYYCFLTSPYGETVCNT